MAFQISVNGLREGHVFGVKQRQQLQRLVEDRITREHGGFERIRMEGGAFSYEIGKIEAPMPYIPEMSSMADGRNFSFSRSPVRMREYRDYCIARNWESEILCDWGPYSLPPAKFNPENEGLMLVCPKRRAALDYCSWLTDFTGRNFDLPTIYEFRKIAEALFAVPDVAELSFTARSDDFKLANHIMVTMSGVWVSGQEEEAICGFKEYPQAWASYEARAMLKGRPNERVVQQHHDGYGTGRFYVVERQGGK